MPLSKEILEKYKSEIFIETGFQTGSGVQKAIQVGFKKIYSIEIVKGYYNKGMEKYKDNSQVTLILGDSNKEFPKLLEQIKEPATIWLDSHFPKYTTLLTELKTLKEHPIKNHIILIDDIRKIKQGDWEDMNMELLIDLIKQINPNYEIKFIDSTIYPEDILVAK